MSIRTGSNTETEPLRVLMVEDEPDHAHLAREFLQAAGAFAVELAPTLEAMWRCLADRRYDVVALDYGLPDGNGLETLQQLRARGHQVPVIMITGRGDEHVAAQAIQCGALDYVVKTGDYLDMLPALIDKAARTHALMQAAQRSLDQIRYQALLLENVNDAVVVWDLSGRLTFWNQAAERLFGRSAAESLGRPAQAAYQSEFDPPVELSDNRGQVQADVERRGRGPSGEEIWVSSTVSALHDGGDRLLGYMDISRDITQRKQLEAQVQAAQHQLAQAARLAAIGELASGVAHQISNPLTTVIAEAQILERNLPAGHPARESADAIQSAGWRAQEAVQRLLAFSRPASATFENLEINQTIRHAVLLVGALIEKTGARLQITLADNLPPVFGNQRQVEDLWVNLLLQARDAVDDGRPHEIAVRSAAAEAGSGLRVVISDDGLLIAPELLPGLFEPSFTGAPHGRGTGLEFSICREITRQIGGEIQVESQAGRGTRFTVTLPAGRSP